MSILVSTAKRKLKRNIIVSKPRVIPALLFSSAPRASSVSLSAGTSSCWNSV